MKSQLTKFESCLANVSRQYVSHKRALHRRYRSEEYSLRLLERFLLDRRIQRIEDIQPVVISEFLVSRPRRQPRSYNHLLGVLRGFFGWLVVQGLLLNSPVQARPRRVTSRRIPFLFNNLQARRLLELAGTLPKCNGAPLRATVYRTIFGLLYGLGLRVGEISRLCCKDVDLDRHLLVIRETKFSKDRLVPYGPRIAGMLEQYLQLRAQPGETLLPDEPFFTLRKGKPVSASTISQTFHKLWPQLGFTVPAGVTPPRVHDLRHAFAVGTLLRWYREGIDPSTRSTTFLDQPARITKAQS